MDLDQDPVLLERLRQDIVAGVPGSDRRLALVLRAALLQHFRSPDREELTQATLFCVWHGMSAFKPENETSFRNWVSKIAAHVAVDSRRQQRARLIIQLQSFPEHQVTRPSPSQWVHRQQQLRTLWSALEELSSKYAQAVWHRLQGGKAKDLAESENVAVGTVHWRLHEGVRRLQQIVRQKFAAPKTS